MAIRKQNGEVFPHATAGIDVGASSHWVALRGRLQPGQYGCALGHLAGHGQALLQFVQINRMSDLHDVRFGV